MKPFLVIAHRGASGYLPEHTLEGAAMAHAMGADFIELDVVLSRDGTLHVLHDLFLDAVSDVSQKFERRHRSDNHFYALDFSPDELQTLRVNERREPNGNASFPTRFPINNRLFRIPTLEEMIQLIQGLNQSTGRDVGLYIEPKSPQWHEEQGQDIVAQTIATLERQGYHSENSRIYLQSFCADSLRRARFEIGTELQLVQLIGENDWAESSTDFDHLCTDAGLQEISSYAQGIGPWLPQIVDQEAWPGTLQPARLVQQAHRLGLFVHAYTLRSDQLPAEMNDFQQILKFLTGPSGIDGVFTDFPDRVVQYLARSPVD